MATFAGVLPTHVGTPFTRFVAEGYTACATRSLRAPSLVSSPSRDSQLHMVGSFARLISTKQPSWT
eukprot:791251-Pyramimonas_sp.AAC.1